MPAVATVGRLRSRPKAAPTAAPPAADPERNVATKVRYTADPVTNAATVAVHRCRRPRSPSGVMLPSIDSPQGDQVDRMAARPATARPNPTSERSATRSPAVEAGVAGTDSRHPQLGIGSPQP